MDEDTLYIGMREFAYLDEGFVESTGYRTIETPGIMSCFGIALYDSDTGTVGLIHADDRGAKATQVEEALKAFSNETDADFDQVEFWTNERGYNSQKNLPEEKVVEGELVEELLSEELGFEVDATAPQDSNPGALGVEYGEGVYFPDTQTAERLDGMFGIMDMDTYMTGEQIVDLSKKTV